MELPPVRPASPSPGTAPPGSATSRRPADEPPPVLLAQRHGTQVAQVIKSILDALDLTPEQLELVPIVVPAQLRLLTQNGA